MSEHGQPEGAAAVPPTGLARAADSIEAFIKPIYKWLAYIGAAALGVMVLAMIWSIIGRRFFNAPLQGSTEITQLGLVIITFLVIGYEHMGRHEKMTVDIVAKHLPKRVQADRPADHLSLGHRHLLHPVLATGEAGHDLPRGQPAHTQRPYSRSFRSRTWPPSGSSP